MLWGKSDADARTDLGPMTIESERLFDELDDPKRQPDGAFALVLFVFLDDCELVAAEAGQHIGIAQRRLQPAGDLDQQPIARRVPQRVVDLLELVQVEHQDAERSAMALGSPGSILEFLTEYG